MQNILFLKQKGLTPHIKDGQLFIKGNPRRIRKWSSWIRGHKEELLAELLRSEDSQILENLLLFGNSEILLIKSRS